MSEIEDKPSINRFSAYPEVLDYLYTQLPMFQRIGAAAYKKDLDNTLKLCEFLNHPQHRFKSVHVAGTNGKGSSSHYLAAIFQSAGYKTGLYTSPHLKNFTERIRINGQEIGEEAVVDFMNKALPVCEQIHPSFFELTVAMAFDYFAAEQVDVAVVEVGMGGRLDSTNVIIPELSLITNISPDHQQWLGDTLEEIAQEKAGIIKDHIPVVISEYQDSISDVFTRVAEERQSKLCFASHHYSVELTGDDLLVRGEHDSKFSFNIPAAGYYQTKNIPGVLASIEILQKRGFFISKQEIQQGVEQMKALTGLKGRWQVLSHQPLLVCDVGHNKGGIELILKQIASTPHEQLHIIWGTVRDKDVSGVLKLLPASAAYYFCQADIPRAMPAGELYEHAKSVGLNGRIIPDVNDAIQEAKRNAGKNDLIYVGGSTFVVAEIENL